jgi:hypothetical protein
VRAGNGIFISQITVTFHLLNGFPINHSSFLMKHLLVFLAVFILFTSEVFGQKPYKWSHLQGPNVGGNSQNSLTWGAKGEIIAITSRGFRMSSDDGNSWISHILLPIEPVYSYSSNMVISNLGKYFYYFGSSYSVDSEAYGVYMSDDYGLNLEAYFKKR